MSSLRIPRDLLGGFEELVALSQDAYESLLNFVDSIQHINSIETFKNDVDKHLESLSVNSGSITSVVVSLASLKVRYPEKEIEKDLYQSFLESSDISVVEELFNKIILQLLDNSKSLILFLKRGFLKGNNERTYLDSEVITDVRFIFDTDLTAKERRAIILHNLKIEVNEGSDDQDIFITLDIDNLINLKNSIDRAIKKEELLKSDYSNIFFI